MMSFKMLQTCGPSVRAAAIVNGGQSCLRVSGPEEKTQNEKGPE